MNESEIKKENKRTSEQYEKSEHTRSETRRRKRNISYTKVFTWEKRTGWETAKGRQAQACELKFWCVRQCCTKYMAAKFRMHREWVYNHIDAQIWAMRSLSHRMFGAHSLCLSLSLSLSLYYSPTELNYFNFSIPFQSEVVMIYVYTHCTKWTLIHSHT